MQKGFGAIYVILGILLLVAGGYYLSTHNLNFNKPNPVDPKTPVSSPISAEIANWKTYTNTAYQYSIQYPADWSIKDTTAVYKDLTVLDAQMFNDDSLPELSDKELLMELANGVNIKKIKERTEGGDAGMGYSNTVTTEQSQGKEIVKVVSRHFDYLPTGGTKDTGTTYFIYIPVGNNFLSLRGDISNKQTVDEIADTFEPSSKTGENYLPPVVILAREDLAKNSNVDPATITVEAIQENEWKDSSLGCPKAGQMYSQVITPGYRVLFYLDKGGSIDYHTDKNTHFVRCY